LSNFGQDVITDFSNFQGDMITLSGFGEKFDKFFTKTEAISSGSNFFFCDQEGVIYYQPNSDGNLFAIIKLIGKPYLLDSDAFEII
jgi:hypothetical protein